MKYPAQAIRTRIKASLNELEKIESKPRLLEAQKQRHQRELAELGVIFTGGNQR